MGLEKFCYVFKSEIYFLIAKFKARSKLESILFYFREINTRMSFNCVRETVKFYAKSDVQLSIIYIRFAVDRSRLEKMHTKKCKV